MRQLFEHVRQSIYGPAYYQELLARPASFSLKYYSALAFFLALFLTIISSVPLVPRVNQTLRDFPEKFFAYYPDSLEVKIEKGIVSTNATEPYVLPFPEELKKSVPSLNSFLVIDTKTPFSVEQFETYKTAFWLGKDQLAMHNESGGIRTALFGTGTNLTVNENTLRGFEQKLEPFFKFVSPVLVLIIFFSLLIALSVNFIYLLFGAILIFFLGRLLKQRWTYGTSYRIGLHAITLPLLSSMILSIINLPVFNFPLLYSTVMLAVVYANFKGVVSSPTTPTPTVLPAPTFAPSTSSEKT